MSKGSKSVKNVEQGQTRKITRTCQLPINTTIISLFKTGERETRNNNTKKKKGREEETKNKNQEIEE